MEIDENEKKHKRKLRFLFIWFFFLLIFLSTVTYAWFTSNRIVELHFFDIHVETDGGLEISENAIDWKSEITIDELKNAYKSYPNSLNQIPGTMKPMSSAGDVDGNGYLNMFYGQVDSNGTKNFYLSTYRKIEERTTELSNNGDFIAFDVFFKSTTPKNLYLSEESYVLPKEESIGRGIENSARVAFIKEGVLPLDTNIGTVQNQRTTSDNNVVIWEPNYDVHTEHGIDNALSTYGITVPATNASTLPYDGVSGTVASGLKVKLGDANSTKHPGLFKQVDVDIYTKREYQGSNLIFELEPGITKMRVYMWLEGQDVDSENKASHGDITYFLQFTLNP